MKNKKLTVFYGILTVLCMQGANAKDIQKQSNANEKAIDLDEVIGIVLQDSDDSAIAKLKFEVAKSKAKAESSVLYPSLAFSGAVAKGNSASSTDLTTTQSNGLSLSYNMNIGAIYGALGKEEDVMVAGYTYAKTMTNIVLDTAKLYYGIKRLKVTLQEYKVSEKLYRKSMAVENVRFKRGLSDKTAFLLAKSSYNKYKALRIGLEANLQGFYAEYKRLVGSEAPDYLPLPDMQNVNLPKTLNTVQKIAYKNNFDILIAASNVKKAGYDLSVAKSAYTPTLSLSGSVNKINSSAVDYTEQKVQLGYSVPLYSGGKNYNYYQQMLQSKLEQEMTFRKARSSLTTDLISKWEKYISAKAAMKAYKQSLDASDLALKGEQIRYNKGLGDIVSLLRAQEKALSAKKDNIKAIEDFAIAVLTLKSYMGKLLNEKMLSTKKES